MESITIFDLLLFGPMIICAVLMIAAEIGREKGHIKVNKICKRVALCIYLIYMGILSIPLIMLILVIIRGGEIPY